MNRQQFFQILRDVFHTKLDQTQVNAIDNALDDFGIGRDDGRITPFATGHEHDQTLGVGGISLIKSFEGFVPYAYDDLRVDDDGKPYRVPAHEHPRGKLTIGYGHTGGVTAGQTVSESEADNLLRADVAIAEQAVRQAVRVALASNQFDALVSLAFNIGTHAFSESTLVEKLNDGDTLGAAEQFLVWNKAGGKVLEGLKTRRAAERALFMKSGV